MKFFKEVLPWEKSVFGEYEYIYKYQPSEHTTSYRRHRDIMMSRRRRLSLCDRLNPAKLYNLIWAYTIHQYILFEVNFNGPVNFLSRLSQSKKEWNRWEKRPLFMNLCQVQQ